MGTLFLFSGLSHKMRFLEFLYWFGILGSVLLLGDGGGGVDGFKLLFEPQDLLPVLPHSVAWPVLNSLNNAVDLLPKFMGAVSSEKDNVTWKGTCFFENEAYIEYTEPKEEGKHGGAILHIKVPRKKRKKQLTEISTLFFSWFLFCGFQFLFCKISAKSFSLFVATGWETY